MDILKYSKHELDLLDDGSEEQQWVNKDVMDIMEVFSKQGHSGFSAGYVMNLVRKLGDWRPLTPLKGTEDEWFLENDEEGSQQNKRCFSVFKEGKLIYDIDRFSFVDPEHDCSYFHGGLAYSVKFPYMPKDTYVIHLPRPDMTNDERYDYIKEHANDNDDMKDISEHLVKRY